MATRANWLYDHEMIVEKVNDFFDEECKHIAILCRFDETFERLLMNKCMTIIMKGLYLHYH